VGCVSVSVCGCVLLFVIWWILVESGQCSKTKREREGEGDTVCLCVCVCVCVGPACGGAGGCFQLQDHHVWLVWLASPKEQKTNK
jgi:hypothetical protein